MRKFNFYLSDEQWRDLQWLGDKTGLPLSDHMRRAFDKYVRSEKRESRRPKKR